MLFGKYIVVKETLVIKNSEELKEEVERLSKLTFSKFCIFFYTVFAFQPVPHQLSLQNVHLQCFSICGCHITIAE